MSEHTPGPDDATPEDRAPEGRTPEETDEQPPASGPEWWATLEPLALRDEIEHNRRSERWLLLIGLVAVVLTVLALILHELTT